MPNARLGFTLVELAIVIVIIGLLVAGVLVGRELIDQAKISRLISDVKKYSAAMETFRAKYNAVPGDMRNAYTFFDGSGGSNICGPNNNTITGCNGNGDRIVGSWANSAESQRVWVHLNVAGINKDVPYYPGAQYNTLVTIEGLSLPNAPGPNAPRASITENSVYSLMNPLMSGNGSNTDPTKFFGQGGLWIVTSTLRPTVNPGNFGLNNVGNTLTPEMAFDIDRKIDDGFPTIGNVIAVKPQSNWAFGNCANGPINIRTEMGTEPSTSITYLLNENRKSCAMMFKTSFD